MKRARRFACWMGGWDLVAGRCIWDCHAHRRCIQTRYSGEYMMWRICRKAVVVGEEKHASRMSGLGLGRVRKNTDVQGVEH
jgi:hypothetical protein